LTTSLKAGADFARSHQLKAWCYFLKINQKGEIET
jgi:hypothetical protein